MPWIDGSTPPPDRSEQQLRALVQAKAGRIRRRRLVASSVVAVGCVAAVVAGAVALAADDGGDASALYVTGTGSGPSLPPESTVPPSTTTVVLASPTTTSPAPSTTIRPVATPTTVRTVPTTMPSTTVPPTTTTSTTTLENLPMCTQSEVLVTATPDKAVYAVGEVVKVAIAAENRSGHVCAPLDPSLEFRDAAGRALGGGAIADMFTMGLPGEPRPTWDPGEVLGATFPIPTRCPPNDTPCPPGTYSVAVSFGPLRSAPAEFRIA